jgi:5-methylcytosine-specific restriction protein A
VTKTIKQRTRESNCPAIVFELPDSYESIRLTDWKWLEQERVEKTEDRRYVLSYRIWRLRCLSRTGSKYQLLEMAVPLVAQPDHNCCMPGVLYLCLTPGCDGYADKTGYCATHRQAFKQQRDSQQAKRSDSRWLKVRALKLQSNPLCEDCLDHGKYTWAQEVHPLKPIEKYPELRLNADNLRSLCVGCHAKRTEKGVGSS